MIKIEDLNDKNLKENEIVIFNNCFLRTKQINAIGWDRCKLCFFNDKPCSHYPCTCPTSSKIVYEQLNEIESLILTENNKQILSK